jgi:NAD(P)-dependent dehydrogenase (short-subunit alcohol dehydrogenase family)
VRIFANLLDLKLTSTTSMGRMTRTSQPTALVTGASKGLGRALARSLAGRGWRLVIDARSSAALSTVAADLPGAVAVRGDVTDPVHRNALAAAVETFDRLDLLVNNASDLGPSPLPALGRYPLDAFRSVYETDVVAPLALTQTLLPELRASGGTVVNISSDAAVEAYPGWGGYGSAKAALDQLSAVLAAEEPDLRVYAVDPGDMRTDMHQAAFPGEDISDRPEPETVVPALLRLLDERPPSGRYRAADWAVIPA